MFQQEKRSLVAFSLRVVDNDKIGRFHARDQTPSQCAFEKVADHFECFCIEHHFLQIK